MRTLSRICVALVTSLLLAQPAAAAPHPQEPGPMTAQEIVRRYLAARGGLDKIKAIRTLILSGPAGPDGKPSRQMIRARPFYLTIGEEGNDGSPWETYDELGLQLRVTGAPGAALRHTAYFDDPLVMSLEPGWKIELTGTEAIEGRDAYRLRVTFPDDWINEVFVDKKTWLLVARRWTAPFHAFGEAVTTETHFSGYRAVNGVLFPTRVAEYDLATGEVLGGVGEWATIEANTVLPPDTFKPPTVPDSPLGRMLNAVFASRFTTGDALGWYHDFQADPATSGIDTERGIEAIGYQALKSGAVPTGMALLQENLALYPKSARAHFGVGRAYRAAGREADALAEFREALKIDPTYTPARDALASARLAY